jgi:hypothetical protein
MTSLETLEGLWQTRPGGLAFAAYAESLEKAGRRAEAEQALAEGVKRWPRHFAGRILLGRLARDRGDLETARVAFQAAVQIDNNSRAALHGLADVCTRQQYLKLAFETWSRLSLLEPENALAAESARKIALQMDGNGSATSAVQIRDNEDLFSREALTEGTSAPASATSHAGIPPSDDFDLNLGELPAAEKSEDPLGFQMPDLSFRPSPTPATPAYAPPDTTSTPLAKFEESGFATLEMPSFPAKTIPPPPLELPKVVADPVAPTESLLRPTLPGPFAIPEERFQQAEATQWMAAPTKANNAPVTGDDIEDRMDEVFGGTSQPLPPSMPPLSTEPGLSGMIAPAGSQPPTATVTGDDVEDRLDEVFGASSAHAPSLPPPVSIEPPVPEVDHPTVEIATDPPVTGDDVENRLNEVFGAPSVHAPALPPPVAREARGDKVTGDDIGDRLGEMFGETGEMQLVAPEPPHAAALVPESTVVSGRDIEGRLDELFGESVIDLTSPIDSVAGAVADSADRMADTSVFTKENVGSPAKELRDETDSTVVRETIGRVPDDEVLVRKPGLESTTELRAGSLQLDPHRLVDEAAKGSEIDPGGSTIDLPTIGYGVTSQPETSIRLTGDDVDSRLDELFASSEFLADPQVTPISAKTGFVARPAHTDPGEVTGEDIEGRLDDLFGSDSDFPVSLPTVTFAEEYLRQGHKDKAVSIYRQLLDRDPSNAELRRRLDEIEGRS